MHISVAFTGQLYVSHKGRLSAFFHEAFKHGLTKNFHMPFQHVHTLHCISKKRHWCSTL